MSCSAHRPRTTDACCELTTAVLVAEVGEPPHVAQTNDLPGHRQHKLHFAAPLASLFHLLLFYLFRSCNGPIGPCLLCCSSCHGSVGQKRNSAWDAGSCCGTCWWEEEGGDQHPWICPCYHRGVPLILWKMADLASARSIFLGTKILC